MSPLTFPDLCLTLQPPWPQAIADAGKRLENRGKGVATQLARYRGLVGLSQSKAFDMGECLNECLSLMSDQRIDVDRRRRFSASLEAPGTKRLCDLARLKHNAGKLWLVAEVVDVRVPGQCTDDPWHVDGQWGIVFGTVYEVEPIACMGGQGAWRPQWCQACKMVVADTHGLTCKACLSTLACGPNMPKLNIVRECEASGGPHETTA